MKHPLAETPPHSLWHLLQNFASGDVADQPVFCGESPAADVDLAIADRLMGVFNLMTAHEAAHVRPEQRPNAGVWEMMKHEFHGEFYRIMTTGNVEGLCRYLRQALRQPFAHGLGPGAQVFEAMHASGPGREANVVLLTDRLVSLAIAVGALACENPEQGPYGQAMRLGVAGLVRLIEVKLGVEIWRPSVSGLFGIEVGPGKLIDVRVPDDVYSATRIRSLLTTFRRARVCEIGAGFGGTAFQAARLDVGPYTIVDLPSINVLQGFFLMKIFGPNNVRMFGEAVEDRQFNVLPYWTFFDPALPFDFVFNRDSMPEMPEARAREYLAEIERRGCPFLSINQEAGALGGQEGVYQLFVSRLVDSHPGLRSAGRHPYWTRKGYVEELFLSTAS